MFHRLAFLISFVITSAAAQQSSSLSIIVEPGDQLGMIAQRYLIEPANSHWDEVAKFNGLKSPFTIYPGMKMLLPAHLLASQSAAAKWIAVTGEVKVYQKSGVTLMAATGGVLGEGERVVLGVNSSAVLELPDASQVKLMGGSEFVLDESRYYKGRVSPNTVENLRGTNAFSGLMRLIQGSVETRATPATDRARPLRIQTPTAVVGVRGTEFRVSYADVTRSEVTRGLVAAQLDDVRKADVAEGFGIKLDPAQSQIPAPVVLLNAPDLSAWTLKQEKLTVEFPSLPSLQAERKVVAYRIQLAADSGMTKVSYNKLFPSGATFRIPDLADGTWYINIRGVDEHGLEGKSAVAVLVLKARPQPPLIQAPKPSEKIVQGQDVPLSWAKLSGANNYVIELQNEKSASTAHAVQDSKLDLKNLAVGVYSWRIATQVKTDQGGLDTGPWSDRQSFTVVATPEPMQGQLDKGGKILNLRWSDQGAKEYELQFAREPSFDATKSLLVLKTTTRPEVSIPDIASGRHFIRYRAIETDGFVSGWSSTMEVTVPTNWMPLWIFLGWAATAL